MVGTPAGKLIQYTPEGEVKTEIPPPPELDPTSQFYPSSVQWLENDLFLAGYASANAAVNEPVEMYVIYRQGETFTFTKFYDPLDSMGVPGRSGRHRYFAGLKDWGGKTMHLSFIISGLASEVAVMHGQPAAKGDTPNWEVLVLEETARGIMPAAKKGLSEDTSCLGMAIDLTSEKSVRQGVQGGIELPDLPPAPRLVAYSQEGVIISFNVQYPDGGHYGGMVKSDAVRNLIAGEEPMESINRTSAPSPAVPASQTAFGVGAYGVPTLPSTIAKPSTAFGRPSVSAFGSQSTPTAFGQSSQPISTLSAATLPSTTAFGDAKTTAFGQSSFGLTSSQFGGGKTNFGQSTSTAFASTFSRPSEISAFGTSAADRPPKSITPSAFGSFSNNGNGLGFGGFGSKPAAASTGFGFGASAFGQAAKHTVSPGDQGSFPPVKSIDLASAFGHSSAFGQSAFGSKTLFAANTPTGSSPSQIGLGGFAAGSTSLAKPALFGHASVPPSLSNEQPNNGDLSFGGFASAIDTSSKPAVTSHPTSPTGLPSKPDNMDDDSPSSSPPGSPPAAMGSAERNKQTVSAAFIKPATAFTNTSSFGSFGKTAASATNDTTTAFAIPKPSISSAPSSTPASVQQSALTSASPAGSAFGQSSVPVAFAKSANLTSTAAGIGKITGGFGNFAAKTASPSGDGVVQSAGGFKGFGGFAASGRSGFTEQNSASSFSSMLSGDAKPPLKVPSSSASIFFSSSFGVPQAATATIATDSANVHRDVIPMTPAVKPSGYGTSGPLHGNKFFDKLEVAHGSDDAGNASTSTRVKPTATLGSVPHDEPEVEESLSVHSSVHSEKYQGSEGEVGDDGDLELDEEYTDQEESYEEESDRESDEDGQEPDGIRRVASGSTIIGEAGDQAFRASALPANNTESQEAGVKSTLTNASEDATLEDPIVASSSVAQTASRPSLPLLIGPSAPTDPLPANTPALKPPALNFKHAALRNSPLGTQPPQTPLKSTTPPTSPAKTFLSDRTDIHATVSAPGYDGKLPSPSSGTTASHAGATRNGYGLGIGPPPPSNPLKPLTSPKAEGRPSMPSPFPLAGVDLVDPRARRLASASSSPAIPPASPVSSVSYQKTASGHPESLSTFAIPLRPSSPVPSQHRSVNTKAMTGVVEYVISELLADMQSVNPSLCNLRSS